MKTETNVQEMKAAIEGMIEALEYRYQSMADAPEGIANAWDMLKMSLHNQ